MGVDHASPIPSAFPGHLFWPLSGSEHCTGEMFGLTRAAILHPLPDSPAV